MSLDEARSEIGALAGETCIALNISNGFRGTYLIVASAKSIAVDMDEPLPAQFGPLADTPVVGDSSATPDPALDPALAANIERWERTPHPRGRKARDPHARSVQYQASGTESMETMLREYLANPTGPPEHTIIEFTFPPSAAFMVYSGDFIGQMGAYKDKTQLRNSLSKTAISIVDALSQAEPREALRKQKAIAKTVVETVQKVDGYRYSFHNNWISKEDSACRFSYYCNDSTLNKGRAANEGASMVGKRKIKPVYECQGAVWIKFSVTYQKLQVEYKHVPVHQTYEERAPPPRKDSKRRKIMELFNPEAIALAGKRGPGKRGPGKKLRDESTLSAGGKRARKRRATDPPAGAGSAPPPDQDESFGPLQDFLTSAEEQSSAAVDPTHDSSPDAENLDPALPQHVPTPDDENATPAGPPVFPAEKLQQLKDSTRSGPGLHGKLVKPRKPDTLPIPGTMSGFLAGDLMVWDDHNKNGKRKSNQKRGNTVILEPLQGIAAAAQEVDNSSTASPGTAPQTSTPMTEMDLLKAKLAEAEQRIQKLEADKARPMGPPGWPPPAQLAQAPPANYGYPPPSYGQYAYQYPPQQIPHPQYPQNGRPPATSQYPPPPEAASTAGRGQFEIRPQATDGSKGPGFRGFKLFQPGQKS